MFARWTIRSQMYFCITMMLIIVALLSISGFQGVFKFRRLTKNIRSRANELPLSIELSQQISELRSTLYHVRQRESMLFGANSALAYVDHQQQFADRLEQVESALETYRSEVEGSRVDDPRIGDNREEKTIIAEVERAVHRIREVHERSDHVFGNEMAIASLEGELIDLQIKLGRMPLLMKQRMDTFAEAARADYHTWIFLSALFSFSGLVLIGVLLWKFNAWFFKPLNILVEGSRKVAAGDYSHRIILNTQDEVAELASAMNDMTRHFSEIRDDLDRQVRERSNEVIRNEQLASVGFLAAGVAHEINNPMATIAWSAESLESRLLEWLTDLELPADDERREEAEVILKYMRRIQDEAFRVKGITDGLLDLSRLGTSTRTETDLRELVEGIVEMVRHLGKNRRKRLVIHGPASLKAKLCNQSIKQVVLNLVTNALDSVDEGGQVDIHLEQKADDVCLRVIDNGCGMSPEVLNHVFEPFFTQKRDGSGTGLGLSIAHRIVTDHKGTLIARSNGVSQGSEFCVTLPTLKNVKDKEIRNQAA